jgi:hypothetical protein
MKLGVRIEAGSSAGTARGFLFNGGVETPIDPAIWVPAHDDIIRILRGDGRLEVVAEDGVDVHLLLSLSTADLPEYDVLNPAGAIFTDGGQIVGSRFVPDGDTVSLDMGGTSGMRDPDAKPSFTNFSGVIASTNPAYGELNLSARSSTTYSSTLDPMTLKYILGIWDPSTKPRAHSATWESTKEIQLGIDHVGLEVHLANLPIRSQNGRTGQESKCICVAPNLQRIGISRLSYSPGYAQPVALPFEYNRKYTEISVELRNSEGELATFAGTTCVCIRFV